MGPARRSRPRALGALLTALALLLVAGRTAGAAPPALPAQDGRALLGGLGAAPTGPGGTSPLAFELTNPFGVPLFDVNLTFGVYGFNPFPGTGPAPLPAAAPTLSGPAGGGRNLTIPVGTLGARLSGWSTPVFLVVPASAPAGTYAVRDLLSFEMNGTAYRFASVGNFAPSVWNSATVLPNGTPTLNLSRLGVSGVLPETAILVRSTTGLDLALDGLLAAAVGFGLVALYVASRRRSGGSRSGARAPPAPENQAPSAFGTSRTREGD